MSYAAGIERVASLALLPAATTKTIPFFQRSNLLNSDYRCSPPSVESLNALFFVLLAASRMLTPVKRKLTHDLIEVVEALKIFFLSRLNMFNMTSPRSLGLHSVVAPKTHDKRGLFHVSFRYGQSAHDIYYDQYKCGTSF